MIEGLPVFMAGGGTVNLNHPVVNLTDNTLNIAPGAAVIAVTPGARVKQGRRAGSQYCQERVSDQTLRT